MNKDGSEETAEEVQQELLLKAERRNQKRQELQLTVTPMISAEAGGQLLADVLGDVDKKVKLDAAVPPGKATEGFTSLDELHEQADGEERHIHPPE